jgi:hypothetical protein
MTDIDTMQQSVRLAKWRADAKRDTYERVLSTSQIVTDLQAEQQVAEQRVRSAETELRKAEADLRDYPRRILHAQQAHDKAQAAFLRLDED